mgnify:CR=1 FL=1
MLHFSNGETLAAPTSTGCIRVVERKPFAVQPAAEFQRGIEQIQKTFEVGHDFYAVVLKYLIAGFRLVVKIQLIRQAGTAPAGNADPNKEVVG